MKLCNIIAFLLLVIIVDKSHGKYEPTWESLDSRPLPQWYDYAKFGIFIHWGVYSVPSFGSEWFWFFWQGKNLSEYVNYVAKNYPEGWTYQQFAKDFKAELFDADKWAEIFANSGAKYVVLTTKHHEGYTMWPSKYSYSWNSVDVGPGRDIVGELGEAIRKQNLIFGVYHSLFEWFNPLHNADKAANFTTQDFMTDKVYPEMVELVEKYKPSVFWSDGDEGCPDTYWRATEFLAWLYNESPVKDVVVTNDRWGDGTACTHGDFFNCFDRYNPGSLQVHKWENAMTIDKKSWGYRRNAELEDFYNIDEFLSELVSTVSCGGNLLVNVGPRKDGTIAAIFQERLQQIGDWLSINGEAIYGTKAWTVQNDTLNGNVWYTQKDSDLYAISLSWPEKNNTIVLGAARKVFGDKAIAIYLLGNEDDGELEFNLSEDKIEIYLPNQSTVKSQWAYVLKIGPPVASTIAPPTTESGGNAVVPTVGVIFVYLYLVFFK